MEFPIPAQRPWIGALRCKMADQFSFAGAGG
jgi:hypothetical protein